MNEKARWSALVIYEGQETRATAVSFCDSMVRNYWSSMDFEVSWCGLADLSRPEALIDTAEKAARANLVVFSLSPEGDLPIEMKAWVERWLGRRGEREGALVGLGDPGTSAEGGSPKFAWLRQAAHRGNLDYLTQMPRQMALVFPESPETYTERAACVTSVLGDILRQKIPPHHAEP